MTHALDEDEPNPLSIFKEKVSDKLNAILVNREPDQ